MSCLDRRAGRERQIFSHGSRVVADHVTSAFQMGAAPVSSSRRRQQGPEWIVVGVGRRADRGSTVRARTLHRSCSLFRHNVPCWPDPGSVVASQENVSAPAATPTAAVYVALNLLGPHAIGCIGWVGPERQRVWALFHYSHPTWGTAHRPRAQVTGNTSPRPPIHTT